MKSIKKSVNQRVKSKFDMAYEMDMHNFKHLPWCVIYDDLSKAEMVEYYNEFKSQLVAL